jgi:hypothetical protein
MRVRPVFWGLFVLVCLGVLTWAALVPTHQPARLSIHLIGAPTPEVPTPVLVVVTDAEGRMIDDAQLVSQAWMTNMPMAAGRISTTPEGQGTYLVQIPLSMVGPWMIAVSMHASGFAPVHQRLFIQVSSADVVLAIRPGSLQVPTGSGEVFCAAAMAARVTA